MRATVTSDHNIQVHMQQCHKVKNSHTENQGKTQQKEFRLTCEWKTAGRSTLFTCHRSGVDPRRCLLIQPVGSHRLVAMSSRRGPPCCKRINVQPGGSMSLNAKTKGDKMGVATPDALSTRCACPPHGGCLPSRPFQDSPAQCSKWHHSPGPTHWRLGLVANQLPPASSHPPQCRGTG